MSSESLKYKGTPITSAGDPGQRFYCTCCGRAETRLAITTRKFFAGFSACCAENVVAEPRATVFSCDMCQPDKRPAVLGDIYPMALEGNYREHPLAKQGWFAWMNVYQFEYPR